MKHLHALVLLVGALTVYGALAFEVHAQVMGSSNFRIQSDSVNTGGAPGTSTNFQLEATVGEAATGRSLSTSFRLQAGYQQLEETFISLSGASAVTLLPSFDGTTSGTATATGSTTVTVVTDSSAGYELSVRATATPALQSGSLVIDDYTPTTADPDYLFSPGSTDAFFGFTPSGVDTATRFLSAAAGSCNDAGGTSFADRCWDGLSTTSAVVARGVAGNYPAGARTTLSFQVGTGAAAAITAGEYAATVVITAIPL